MISVQPSKVPFGSSSGLRIVILKGVEKYIAKVTPQLSHVKKCGNGNNLKLNGQILNTSR